MENIFLKKYCLPKNARKVYIAPLKWHAICTFLGVEVYIYTSYVQFNKLLALDRP